MQIKVNDNEFQLFVGEKRILEHSKERPMIYVGVGQEDVDMYRGNFKITDYVTERFPLKLTDGKVGGCRIYKEQHSIYAFKIEQARKS